MIFLASLLFLAPLCLARSNKLGADLEGYATDPVTERAITRLKADQTAVTSAATPQAKAKIEKDVLELAQQARQRAASQPKSVAVQHSAARFALQAGDNGKALAFAERAVALAQAGGDPRALRRTLLTLSMARAANKDYAGACAEAQRVLRDEPRDATAVELRLFNCERPRLAPSLQATDTFRWLAQQSPEVPHTPEQWARRQKEHPTAAFAAVGASMQALKAGDAAAALRRAEEAVAADGSDPMAWAQRGLVQSRLEDFNAAVLDLSRAIAMGMVWNVLYRLRAEALIKAGSYPAAIGDASVAISLDPKDAVAYADRATAKLGAGMSPRDILADFDAAARLDPARYQAALERAKADLTQGAGGKPAGGEDAGLSDQQRRELGRVLSAGLDGGAAVERWAWAGAAGLGLAFLVGLAALKRRRRGSGIP